MKLTEFGSLLTFVFVVSGTRCAFTISIDQHVLMNSVTCFLNFCINFSVLCKVGTVTLLFNLLMMAFFFFFSGWLFCPRKVQITVAGCP